MKNFFFNLRLNYTYPENQKYVSFMDQKFSSNKIDKDDFILKNQENDYKILITRLKEINFTIALLQKQYLDKF